MSYPLTPPNPERARVERNALLEVEKAARGYCASRYPATNGWYEDLITALAALDEARKEG